MTIHEVSKLAGVSVRALQYYDRIGLLVPHERSAAGYRLYNSSDLARLQQILLLRELQFSLKDIKQILETPDFDQQEALKQQIELLKLKRDRLTKLVCLAQELKEKGTATMSFDAFDTSEIEAYAKQAKEQWGATPQWQEYEQKNAGLSAADQKAVGDELMQLFVPFGKMAAEGVDPASSDAVAQAKRIQAFISEHYYECSNEVFAQLGQAYGSGGDFTRNINQVAGEGAGEFAAQAVAAAVA